MNNLVIRIGRCLPLFAISMGLSVATAADIDIYSGVSGTDGSPNVLFFIDNTSNWSASNQAWEKITVKGKCDGYSGTAKTTCQAYVEAVFGTDAKLVQGQVELRALKLVLNELVCKTDAKIKVNAGVMFFSADGSVDSKSVGTSYIRHRIAPLDTSQCAVLLADLDAISADITGSATKAPSSAAYGTALFEAFKYFGGWTNPAGALTATQGTPANATAFGKIRYSLKNEYEDPKAFTDSNRTTYQSPGDSVCGNNYIVLIGNTWPNQEYSANQNAAPYPIDPQMTRLGYIPGAQIYPVPLPNKDKSDVRFADEWAKFLYDTDVSDAAGVQNVRMFTVDVYNATADAKQSALLKSMALQSSKDGSGYFKVGGDLKAMIDAFTDILTQVAAVDSVFASASLPVSVNAQGTYLNQVFMGVFRPDGAAQQRWTGNLKQYKFALSGGALSLVDADGKPAVDAVNSGFINHCARSYWTTGSGDYWKTITGMDTESGCNPATNTALYSDSPDGPLVERGGAGQRLRDLGYANRNIRICIDAGCTGTESFIGNPPFGTTLADWVRGKNEGDGNIKASDGVVTYEKYGLTDTATRPTVHGEVVHSRPLAINYGINGADDVVVFYGAGDGMLRAVNGNQGGNTLVDEGKEVWAFMAPEHYTTIERVRTNSPLIAFPNVKADLLPTPTPKTYFFDGSIGGYQERNASAIQKIWIYATMRRGGRSIYAFDVTKMPGTTNQPVPLWKYGADENALMGESWSTPTVIRIEGKSEPLVVFGAGYDACEDSETSSSCDAVTIGKGIVIADAKDGSKNNNSNYRFIGDGTGLDSTAGRFVADVTAVDVNQDGYTDVLYAADTRGNIWRINTSDPATGFKGLEVSKWPVNKIATVSDWAVDSEKRKFMYSPSVVALGTQTTVLIGTGDREKPSAGSYAAKVNNRFYGIRDDVTKTKEIEPVKGFGAVSSDIDDLEDLKNVTTVAKYDAANLTSFKGWFREFKNKSPNEQVVTTPLTFAGVTYFSTYQAKDSSGNICKNLGTGRSYQVDFQTGTKPVGVESVSTTFITEGIPPSPVGGLVEVGGVTVPFVIGGPGPTPLSPVKIIPKVRADRKPVYRYQRIDQ